LDLENFVFPNNNYILVFPACSLDYGKQYGFKLIVTNLIDGNQYERETLVNMRLDFISADILFNKLSYPPDEDLYLNSKIVVPDSCFFDKNGAIYVWEAEVSFFEEGPYSSIADPDSVFGVQRDKKYLNLPSYYLTPDYYHSFTVYITINGITVSKKKTIQIEADGYKLPV